jgi:hypothetical protein
MAAIFPNPKTEQHLPSPPAAAAAPINKYAYGDDLKDDEIIKKTVAVTIAAHPVKIGQISYVLKLALECKASAFEDVADKAKIIDGVTDEQQLKFELCNSDGTAVCERAATFLELKSLKAGDWFQNELAIRTAARIAFCLANAHFSAEVQGEALKLTFITGDKKYGARTIVSIPKPVPKQVVLVEIANQANPNMG